MTSNTPVKNSSGPASGAVLAAASVLGVLVMAHHPTNTGQAFLANLVHGALMILQLLLFAGFARFAARLGMAGFCALTGLVFYGAAVCGNLLAATINGFAVPALAAREPSISQDIFRLAWELNQALAYAAVYAASVAFILWGAALIARGRMLAGIAGIAAGGVPAALLAIGSLDMHVAGAFAAYSIQAAFGLIIGILIMRGKV